VGEDEGDGGLVEDGEAVQVGGRVGAVVDAAIGVGG
jgi:hypothetical protein